MKQVNLITALVLLTFLCTIISCTKDFDGLSDYNTKKYNILGDWDYTYTWHEYIYNYNDSTDLYVKNVWKYNFSFYADGTVLYGKDKFTHSDVLYKWYFQYDPQKIILKNIRDDDEDSSWEVYHIEKITPDSIKCITNIIDNSKIINGKRTGTKTIYESIFKRK